MTAWEALKAASSLAIGSAWELLTHPLLGNGLIVNDGVFVEVPLVDIEVEVADPAITAEVQDTSVTVEVTQQEIEVEVSP